MNSWNYVGPEDDPTPAVLKWRNELEVRYRTDDQGRNRIACDFVELFKREGYYILDLPIRFENLIFVEMKKFRKKYKSTSQAGIARSIGRRAYS